MGEGDLTPEKIEPGAAQGGQWLLPDVLNPSVPLNSLSEGEIRRLSSGQQELLGKIGEARAERGQSGVSSDTGVVTEMIHEGAVTWQEVNDLLRKVLPGEVLDKNPYKGSQ